MKNLSSQIKNLLESLLRQDEDDLNSKSAIRRGAEFVIALALVICAVAWLNTMSRMSKVDLNKTFHQEAPKAD
jgi:hypothetical protein